MRNHLIIMSLLILSATNVTYAQNDITPIVPVDLTPRESIDSITQFQKSEANEAPMKSGATLFGEIAAKNHKEYDNPVSTPEPATRKYPSYNPSVDNEAIYRKQRGNDFLKYVSFGILFILIVGTIVYVLKMKPVENISKIIDYQHSKRIRAMGDKITQLKELERLRNEGTIDNSEFEVIKAEILKA